MVRNMIGVLIIILLLGTSTAAFAYWDSTQTLQEETITIGEGISIDIDAEVTPPENTVLVPFGAVMKEGDVNEMTLTYLVRLDTAPDEEVVLEVLASNVRINGSVEYAHLVNFDYETSAPNLSEGYLRATIYITIDEPSTREMYDAVKNGIITFTMNFHASNEIYSVNLDFTEMTMDDLLQIGAASFDMDSWSTEDGTPLTNSQRETRLLFPISQDEYTLTVTAQLMSESTIGGYGIYFDTYTDIDDIYRDYGYIFQFDRGYTSNGGMIVRERLYGGETGPVWTQFHDDIGAFPSKIDDPDWWTDIHEIKIAVTSIDENTRQASMYLDGIHLGTFTYEDSRGDNQIYVGFRGWSSITDFYSLTIQ